MLASVDLLPSVVSDAVAVITLLFSSPSYPSLLLCLPFLLINICHRASHSIFSDYPHTSSFHGIALFSFSALSHYSLGYPNLLTVFLYQRSFLDWVRISLLHPLIASGLLRIASHVYYPCISSECIIASLLTLRMSLRVQASKHNYLAANRSIPDLAPRLYRRGRVVNAQRTLQALICTHRVWSSPSNTRS